MLYNEMEWRNILLLMLKHEILRCNCLYERLSYCVIISVQKRVTDIISCLTMVIFPYTRSIINI